MKKVFSSRRSSLAIYHWSLYFYIFHHTASPACSAPFYPRVSGACALQAKDLRIKLKTLLRLPCVLSSIRAASKQKFLKAATASRAPKTTHAPKNKNREAIRILASKKPISLKRFFCLVSGSAVVSVSLLVTLFKLLPKLLQNHTASKMPLDPEANFDLNGQSLAHRAAKNRNLPLLKQLAKHDPTLFEKRDDQGRTLLHAFQPKIKDALSEPHVKCRNYLLKRVSLDAQDENGETIAHYAAKEADLDFLENMKEYKATFAKTDKQGRTLLHTFVANFEKRRAEGVSEKIERECGKTLLLLSHELQQSLTAFDKHGQTAAHYASVQMNDLFLQLLKEHEQSALTAKNAYGHTLLHALAFRAKNELCNQELKAPPTPAQAVETSAEQCFNLLIPLIDANKTDAAGKSAAHYAAEKCDLPMLQHLKAHQANFEKSDYNQQTLLHAFALGLATQPRCAPQKIVDCVQFIIDSGTPIGARDKQGNQALDYAKKALKRKYAKEKTQEDIMSDLEIDRLLSTFSALLTPEGKKC